MIIKSIATLNYIQQRAFCGDRLFVVVRKLGNDPVKGFNESDNGLYEFVDNKFVQIFSGIIVNLACNKNGVFYVIESDKRVYFRPINRINKEPDVIYEDFDAVSAVYLEEHILLFHKDPKETSNELMLLFPDGIKKNSNVRTGYFYSDCAICHGTNEKYHFINGIKKWINPNRDILSAFEV